MIIIKSAVKQLKRNPLMNILIITELAAVLTIMFILISLIESRFEYYLPFSDEFGGEGYLCNFEMPTAESDITELAKNGRCEFTYYGQFYVNGQQPDDENIPCSVMYDDKWINAYTPTMQSGVWLDNTPDDGKYHAVVTPENPLKLKAGDAIKVSDYDGKSIDVEIIGVLNDKQYVLGCSFFSQTDVVGRNNFFDMYYTYNTEVEADKWGLFFSKDELIDSPVCSGESGVYGMGFVMTDDMNESDRKALEDALRSELAPGYTKELSEIRQNSFAYIKEQLYVLLPIALCIFVLTLITTVSVISISVNSQLRTYAILYICGAKWRQCALISFVYSLMIGLVSCVVCSIALAVVTRMTQTVIKYGRYEILSAFLVLTIFLVFSALIPHLILHGNRPKEILKKE